MISDLILSQSTRNNSISNYQTKRRRKNNWRKLSLMLL